MWRCCPTLSGKLRLICLPLEPLSQRSRKAIRSKSHVVGPIFFAGSPAHDQLELNIGLWVNVSQGSIIVRVRVAGEIIAVSTNYRFEDDVEALSLIRTRDTRKLAPTICYSRE